MKAYFPTIKDLLPLIDLKFLFQQGCIQENLLLLFAWKELSNFYSMTKIIDQFFSGNIFISSSYPWLIQMEYIKVCFEQILMGTISIVTTNTVILKNTNLYGQLINTWALWKRLTSFLTFMLILLWKDSLYMATHSMISRIKYKLNSLENWFNSTALILRI